MTLDDLKIHDKAIITGYRVESRRLVEMGFFIDREIELIEIAPLNCPLLFKLGNSCVAIRRKEAKKIYAEIAQR